MSAYHENPSGLGARIKLLYVKVACALISVSWYFLWCESKAMNLSVLMCLNTNACISLHLALWICCNYVCMHVSLFAQRHI